MWKAEVYVTLKKTVLDPQGATVQNALRALGYKNVVEVRVGKFMELAIEGGDRGQVAAQVEEMCRRLQPGDRGVPFPPGGNGHDGEAGPLKFGVVVFPGSNCDADCFHVVKEVLGQPVDYVWHQERDLQGYDCVILPGGFSYGDYLRSGAIARFSPVMGAVEDFASRGGLVLGICNGFQILLEAGLLPGAMRRNDCLQFRCHFVHLRVENPRTPYTSLCREGQVLRIPIAHAEGNYYADGETLRDMEARGQVVFRYCDGEGMVTPASNPNGSVGNVAGVCNREGNVLGMMPHPERAAESILGAEDGRLLLESICRYLEGR